MSPIRYSYHDMTDIRHRFREMTKITGGRDQAEYRGRLHQMMEMGMSVWIAEQGGFIIGTIGFMTEPGETGWTKSEEMKAAARKKNIEPDTVQVRSLIYVHPDHRGKGIAHELEKRANATSRGLGFKYRAAFAYDNELIYRWIHRHGNAIDLGMDEPTGTGFPATVVPIDTP